MVRGRVVVVPALAVAILVPACVLSWWDPFNLRYAGFFTAASTGLSAVAVATVAILVWRRRAVTIAAVVLGAVGLVFAGGVVWLTAATLPGPERDRVASPDGRYELVRVRGVVGSEVRLRRDRGLLSQESVVWYDDGGRVNGLDSGTVVPTFRFADARSVEVTTYDNCSHRSAFDPTTLVLEEEAQFRASTC